jgi:hypothetical protein
MFPWPSTQVKATSFAGPAPAGELIANSLTKEHSAQRVSPYEAFSTLQPEITRPSSVSAATPTGNFE